MAARTWANGSWKESIGETKMKEWPDRRILDLFGIELPIILAPMPGPGNAALAIAVSEAGGLGSLPCAQLSVGEIRAALETKRRSSARRAMSTSSATRRRFLIVSASLHGARCSNPISSSLDWIRKLHLPLLPANHSTPNRV